jgi:hypothetical protein
MSDFDDDFESQRGDEAETSQPKQRTDATEAEREKLWREWLDRFGDFADRPAMRQWMATHIREVVELPIAPFRGLFQRELYITPIAGCTFKTSDKAMMRFERHSEIIRRKLKRLDEQNRGARKPSEILDFEPEYMLAGAIPMRAGSMIFGHRKHGKSAWAQKLAVCAGHGLSFDGVPIKHGRVLYKSLDPDAGERETKWRMKKICKRLGVTLSEEAILIDETPIDLADPASVDSFLTLNPGRFALIVLDPYYMMIPGGASREDLARPVMEAIKQIADETGAAVLLAHHRPRGKDGSDAHPFGTVFLEAGLSGMMHITRGARDIVTLTPQFVKNGSAREPLKYQLDQSDGYLEAIDPAAPTHPRGDAGDAGPLVRADMLALMPTTPTPIREARKLIEHMLSGTDEAKGKQWYRARMAWVDAGAAVQDDDTGTIRRVVEVPSEQDH